MRLGPHVYARRAEVTDSIVDRNEMRATRLSFASEAIPCKMGRISIARASSVLPEVAARTRVSYSSNGIAGTRMLRK